VVGAGLGASAIAKAVGIDARPAPGLDIADRHWQTTGNRNGTDFEATDETCSPVSTTTQSTTRDGSPSLRDSVPSSLAAHS
jgi:hypothetical protein